MRKTLFAFVCAGGAAVLSATPLQADSLLFSRMLDAPASRSGTASVEAEFPEEEESGFTLDLDDLIVEAAAAAGNDMTLAGLSLGMSAPGAVHAISRVLLAGSHLGGGASGGGGGASGGGSGTASGLDSGRGLFNYGTPSANWQDFVAGGRRPAGGGGSGFPSFAGSSGGPFTGSPSGLLGDRRPGRGLPDRVRDRLEDLLAGLRGGGTSSGAESDESGLALIPGEPPSAGSPSADSSGVVPSPEPSSLALMGIGLASVAGMTWRRRRRPVTADAN